MLDEKRAQGSMEYLLLIGGVIVVAAVIGLYLKNAANSIKP
ncbi:MAG: class III signal peptide-containing protein [Candidatus ainarchaeum sp.]|nr:class III signal peptide-containing protein [Candidatus ainarchaeum sp.]